MQAFETCDVRDLRLTEPRSAPVHPDISPFIAGQNRPGSWTVATRSSNRSTRARPVTSARPPGP
jgi:hypothetical protein